VQNREKFIVSMAVIALLYFIIDSFVLSDENRETSKHNLSQECEEFLVEGNAILNVIKSSSELFRRLSLLEEGESKNPFIRDWLQKNEIQKKAKESAERASRSIRYTGYIESAGRCMVVINGKEYLAGQKIDGTDLVIKKVSRKYILLEPESGETGKKITITVAKEEQDEISKP